MNRRQLLLSSGAAALAAMLPIPVLAAIPAYPNYDSITIEKLGLIEQALDVGELYGFDVATRVTLFGLNPHTIESLAALREVVQEFLLDYGSIDVWNRIRFLIAIREQLDKRFPGDVAAQLKWMNTSNELFRGQRLRDWMNDDHMQLYNAACVTGSDVEPHGFAEMRDFVG